MAREKGGKKAEDASFKTLLDRLDSGVDRAAGVEGLSSKPAERARVVPMPGMRPPPVPLRAGEPLSSTLAGLEAKVHEHESGRRLGKSGLLAACFTGGLTTLGVIWLVITYWSIGSGRGMPSIEPALAASTKTTAEAGAGSSAHAVQTRSAAEIAAPLVTASFAPVEPRSRDAEPMTLSAETSPPASQAATPSKSPETTPAAAIKPADSQPTIVAQDVLPPAAAAPVTRPTAALPPVERSLTYAASDTKLLVAPLSRAIAGESSPLAIKVDAPGIVLDKLQVIVGGLPAGAFLSAGIARGPDTWQVPVRGLESLLIRLPVATREDVSLTLDLTDGAGASLARATTLIAVLPAALPSPQEVAKAPAPPAAAAPSVTAPSVAAPSATTQTAPPPAETPAPPRLTMDETTALIERGRLLVRNGDIASARLMFERAADAGSGRAAYLMGETFDPDVLASLRALGLRGDLAKARQWYNRANELGTSAAADRLRALAGR